MTSEEIKNLKRGFGDAMDWTEAPEQFAHRAIDGIWEIAFQLAVMNERESRAIPRLRWRCPNCGPVFLINPQGHVVCSCGKAMDPV